MSILTIIIIMLETSIILCCRVRCSIICCRVRCSIMLQSEVQHYAAE